MEKDKTVAGVKKELLLINNKAKKFSLIKCV